eukprot:jgi/Mesen1/10534/ME000083S10041
MAGRRLWCLLLIALVFSSQLCQLEAKKVAAAKQPVEEEPAAPELDQGGEDVKSEDVGAGDIDPAGIDDEAADADLDEEPAGPVPIKNITSGGVSNSSAVTASGGATGVIPLQEDIKADGNCSAAIKLYCKDIAAGDGALATCITIRVQFEKAGNDDKATPVSDECKAEVRAFKVEMYKDIVLDKKMARSCKKDIQKYCDDDFLYPEPGNIVACLREVNQVNQVEAACKKEIFRAQQEAANDFKLDPQLNELCSSEAEKLCKDVPAGEGLVQNCLVSIAVIEQGCWIGNEAGSEGCNLQEAKLFAIAPVSAAHCRGVREHRNVLAWDCQAELFRQEVENADDIRLNVRLFQACLNDKKKFCPEVIPGDARVKDCLEANRLKDDFSPACKTEFDKMMERRATDFRLDSNLRKYCKQDIAEICYPDAEDITDVANWDAKVIQCLQDYRDELKDPKCRKQVHRLTKRAAEDIRFDKPLAEACHKDRTTICKDVPDGMAQVFRCLQDHRDELQEVCRSALFDQEVRMAEDIDFKFPMKQACSEETMRFCKDISTGHAAVIKCLQEKVDDADMGDECKKEIKRDEFRSAEDYRLNYRLNKACFNDVQKMCLHACDKALEINAVTCGGTVLKCLTDNLDKVESEACKKEVFSFEKLQVADVRMDVPLQTACKGDLAKLCPDVSKDHSRTLTCLRGQREKLSEDCKEEEMRFSIMEASDIRLTPSLMNACGQELQGFCKDVPSSEGQAFKCLQTHLEDIGMGAACKGEVNLQEARHSSNYRLDVRVRKECEADLETVGCKNVDEGNEGHALVLRCMVSKFKKLSASCQTEVSYAVRMALWQYKEGAELTQSCDKNVKELCTTEDAKPINGAVIGSYGQCLIGQKWSKLDPGCKVLVKVSAKEGAYVGGQLDDTKLAETLAKIAEVEPCFHCFPCLVGSVKSSSSCFLVDHLKAGGGGGSSGLVITGWVAFAAVGALVVVLIGGGYGIYRHCYGNQRPYTLVVKGGDV